MKTWRGDRQRPDPLDPTKRLPMYQAAQRELLIDPVADPARLDQEVPGRAQALKNMYVAFTDFNTGLRNVWLNE